MKDKTRVIWIGALLVALNVLGDAFSVWRNLPIWLDTFGTMLAGYFFGPIAGGVVGFSSHILICVKDGSNTWLYAFGNMLIGILVAEEKRRGYLKNLYGFCTAGLQLAIVSMAFSVPNTLLLRNNVMVNDWGNDIIQTMLERNLPPTLAVVLGEFYVDFVDKIILMYVLYFGIRLYEYVRYGKKPTITKMEVVNFLLLPMMVTAVVVRSRFKGNFVRSDFFKDYIIVVDLLFVSWLGWLLSEGVQRRELDRQKKELDRLKEKNDLIKRTVLTISHMVDAKDIYTARHSSRVTKYSLLIGEQLGFSPEEMEKLERAAILHDIGKVAIPDRILNKKGKLTAEEFRKIKSHPVIGAEILKDFDFAPQISEGAMYHHERYDGTGYPDGLKGEEIPLFGRIIAIADAYDAMSSNRVYRPKCTREYILSEFERNRGIQFDPKLCDIFIGLMKDSKVDDFSWDTMPMTVQRAYEVFGGRYEIVHHRFKNDETIVQKLRHFVQDKECHKLGLALENGDAAGALEIAGIMREATENLGLENLAQECGALVETLKGETITPETAELFEQLEDTYQAACLVIYELDGAMAESA